VIQLRRPYLLFLGDAGDQLAAKTAQGVRDWRPDWCVGQLRLPGCKADLGLPDIGLHDAYAIGARTLVVGVSNRGGQISPDWMPTLSSAVAMGFDIASGMHDRLNAMPELLWLAERSRSALYDLRYLSVQTAVGNGAPRAGQRLLTVGTDCSCGKMYTALAIERELRQRGHAADFRATGQTGVLIAGSGIAVDAVVADFMSGAVEQLVPAGDPDHWDVIEGQGSLFHPSYAGVSLALLHGAQPTALVLCHEPTRKHLRGLPLASVPSLRECLEANLRAARVTSPGVRCVGVSINTSRLAEPDARRYITEVEREIGLPTVDPVRHGVESLVDGLARA
jgi:uncharacterized NAD-dependent epimerase/dehydratase family protein